MSTVTVAAPTCTILLCRSMDAAEGSALPQDLVFVDLDTTGGNGAAAKAATAPFDAHVYRIVVRHLASPPQLDWLDLRAVARRGAVDASN